jgi:UDP-2,3-diacylglucosamine pyrophosphatase LpxH
MKKNTIYFLSDVHIGTNSPTDWYQDNVHGPYLEAVFNFINKNSSATQELVLLGDFVDQWTYLPNVKTPSFAEIIQNNPRIFGGNFNGSNVAGTLLTTLDALNGNITYINGNHDMSVTANDIAVLKSPDGNIIKSKDIFYTPDIFQNKLLCTHGHAYSLFNAPDFQGLSQYPGLPFGFFITRLSALWSSQQYTQDKPNDAYLPNSGNPNGAVFETKALEGVIKSLHSNQGEIASLIMNALLNATNSDQNLTFIMPDGQTVTVQQVKNAYDPIFAQYPSSTNIQSYYYPDGEVNARESALSADVSNDLTPFAHQLGKKAKVIVMGHTHVSEDDLQQYPPSLYANSGFLCPSIPDMAANPPSFVEVVLNNSQFVVTAYKVFQSGDQYNVSSLYKKTIKC